MELHIKTKTCKNQIFNSIFDELTEAKYFKEIKDLKSKRRVTAEAHLEPKRASTMKLFFENN